MDSLPAAGAHEVAKGKSRTEYRDSDLETSYGGSQETKGTM